VIIVIFENLVSLSSDAVKVWWYIQ